VVADELTMLTRARGDAVVASLPTLAYAAGGIHSLRTGAVAGVGCALVVCAFAARRRPLAAVGGLIAVIIAVGIALITKRPTSFFLPGIALNAVCAAGGLVSLATRRPALAYLLSGVLPRFANWRSEPALRKLAAAITAVWSAVFLLRFVIMGGCYLSSASPSVLAVVKVVLGLPLAAVAAAISLRLLADQPTPVVQPPPVVAPPTIRPPLET
jgi:hypothetical protein